MMFNDRAQVRGDLSGTIATVIYHEKVFGFRPLCIQTAIEAVNMSFGDLVL